MSFWNSDALRSRIKDGQLVTPFRPERIANAAYELALGGEAFVSSSMDGKKTSIAAGEQLVIPPGQFALLLTEEVVRIPPEAIGLISIKAGMKLRGLVNVSGFHVDPGFNARLKFSVYNAGNDNIVLDQGKSLFLLWLCDLSAPTPTGDLYMKSSGKNEISGQDVMHLQGEVASPAALKKDLEEVRRELTKIKESFYQARSILITIGVGLLVAFLKGCLPPSSTRDTGNPQPSPSHEIQSPSSPAKPTSSPLPKSAK